MKTINAFILSAGLGERLRPITNHIPKPLIPILGEPVLSRIMQRLLALPVNKIGLNMHYKWEMIADWARKSAYSEKIELFHEVMILGTGGALKNASSLLKACSAFVVYNADIICDISLHDLLERHIKSGNMVTLAVHDNERFNNVWIDSEGFLRSVGKNISKDAPDIKPVAFTGIAAYSGEFLGLIPEGRSSVVDSWLRAVASGYKVGTIHFEHINWADIGTPADYASVVRETLYQQGETLYVNASAECSRLEISGFAVIERGVSCQGAASVKDSILLPDSIIPEGAFISNAIQGPDYKIILENKGLPSSSLNFSRDARDFFGNDLNTNELIPIGAGGSDRTYYRSICNGRSLVVMQCPSTFPDYERNMAYTHFFRRYSLPVPEILFYDKEAVLKERAGQLTVTAIFEDLGDITLYSWLKFIKSPQRIEVIYRNVIDILIKLHTTITSNVSECPLLESRVFDYDHFRWETGYFLDKYVSGICQIHIDKSESLEKELEGLAQEADTFKKVIIHRDFQSQNIMIQRGDIPRIIDYQGARIGPPAYDIASFLYDPYNKLTDGLRGMLYDYYVQGITSYLGRDFDEGVFSRSLLVCRLQRHMQALGAYGFLSQDKGKKYFLKYIPQALSYLFEEVALVRREFPLLYDLVKTIHEKIEYRS